MGMALPRSILLLCLASAALSPAPAEVDYARDIQPILAEHCLLCHGPDDSKGGLTLTSFELATNALKSGAHAIMPGKPEQSAVIERMTTTDPDEQMPPPEQRAKKPVTARETELLRQWIAAGAKYDLHWAYKPVVRPAVPEVRNPQSKIRNAIDAFIQQKLAAQGIAPSPEADAHTLVRRLSLDLTGLPPSLDLIERHCQPGQSSLTDAAYERLVDELLQSPHFGERWGRHWLDMARYADSDGYEKDRPRPDAWRFRDWVIRAINDDMPFDQFTIEQLAGDLLPDATAEQLVATAFNRQTLTNTEGGTDQEQFRVEACMDRAETVGTVWLGLTVGCARCHTHKYDQITIQEYYQLYAFFDNGDEATRQAPVSPEAWAEYEKKNGQAARLLIPLQKRLDEAKAALPLKLPEWEKAMQARLAKARADKPALQHEPVKIAKVDSQAGAKFQTLEDGSVLASGKQIKDERYTVRLAPSDKAVTSLQIEVLPHDTLPKQGPGRSSGGNFVLSEVRVTAAGKTLVAHSPKASFEQKTFGATGAVDGKGDTGWAVSGGAGKAHKLTLHLAEPVPAGAEITLELDQNYAKDATHTLGRFRILAASQETEETLLPAAVIRILNEEPRRRNPVVIQALYDWLEKTDADVIAAAAALQNAQDKLPKPPLMDVRVIAQRAQNPRQSHVLHRGDFLQPAEPVTPAVLGVASQPGAKREASTRLDLARWLVSRENPLTARVTVNHIWARLFGIGLVHTPGDFGVRGERPTHPELLDWLAAEFMERGWSRKQFLKTVLLSATYRQSSAAARPAAELARIQELDPNNSLLWRQNRLRVEGEIVRDLHLAASGLLSPKIGGPSVFPPMPEDVAALSYANNFKWTTSKGGDRHRRGMYTFFKRTSPHPDLMTFDCPDSNITNIQRTVSNTPLQALTTLNAETYAEAAQALAKRVLTTPGLGNDEERLSHAFRLCLSRAPSAREIAALKKLLTESRYHYEASPDEAKAAVSLHPAADIPPPENAAWTATARILLNMDEFITRG
ncbi:MAG TPA: hypothetical protein DIT13_08430 [Verrucomicrobiales bacterium]|nr:hypothetical protein [Verrucomicrobiales bacterium]